MAGFTLIQDSEGDQTFAVLHEDGSLLIQTRHRGYDGHVLGRDDVNLSPEGIKNLLALLDPRNLTLRGADGTVGELVPLSKNSTSERKPASGK